MFRTITVRRLSAGSVYKIAAIGTASTFMPFSLVAGVFALFEASTVFFDGQPVTGVRGLFVAMVLGVVFSVLGTLAIGTCAVISLWLRSLLGPITYVVKVDDPLQEPAEPA